MTEKNISPTFTNTSKVQNRIFFINLNIPEKQGGKIHSKIYKNCFLSESVIIEKYLRYKNSHSERIKKVEDFRIEVMSKNCTFVVGNFSKHDGLQELNKQNQLKTNDIYLSQIPGKNFPVYHMVIKT